MTKIKYMTEEAIETIRANQKKVSNYISASEDNSWLYDLCGKTPFEEKEYCIEDFELKTPLNNLDRETDFYDSVMLYNALNKLPGYVLSNERFWAWLNFEKCYDTARILMPIKSDSTLKYHYLFSNSVKRSLSFGVLSRMYYRVALTVDNTLEDKYEITKWLIDSPVKMRGLFWRSLSNNPTIFKGVSKAEMQFEKETGIVLGEKSNSILSKRIQRLGSVSIIDVYSEEDICEYAKQELYDIYNINDKHVAN